MSLVVDKANALVSAWKARYGDLPGINTAMLLLSVADLETGLGEYRGVKGLQLLDGPSHNWGQIQRRQLTAAEKEQFSRGVIPTPRDDNEFLSGDTSPDTGAYRVWLWRFPDDIKGADKLLSVIVDGEKIRNQLEMMSPEDLARSMYNARYYEGSHSRTEPGGPEANIKAYGGGIAGHYKKLSAALGDWKPGLVGPVDPNGAQVPPPPTPPDAPVIVATPDFPVGDVTPESNKGKTFVVIAVIGGLAAAIFHACTHK